MEKAEIASSEKAEQHNNPPPQKNEPPQPPQSIKYIYYTLGTTAVATLGAVIASYSGADLMGYYCRMLACIALLVFAYKKRNMTAWIIVAMIIGLELGYDHASFAVKLGIFSKIFIKLIKSLVAPLLISTLVVGIAGQHDAKAMGRIGLKAIIYFEIVTTLALIIGLAAINISQVGVGMAKPTSINTSEALNMAQSIKPLAGADLIIHAFPENICKSIADNEILQIVVFSMIFGIALAQVPMEKRRPLLSFCESLSETMFKYTNIVMYLAPLAVGGAVAYTVGDMGLGVMGNLFKLMGTFYAALLCFFLFVLLPVVLMARLNIKRFLKAIFEPALLAFSTSSSEAALPGAMANMQKFGVPRHIVAFVMPMGYSLNLDGSTLYLALCSIFLAQAGGIDMPISSQIMMMVSLMLTSKGVAAVPRATLIILLGTAASFQLPEWPVTALLGVDAFMDMGRTATNLIGNCLASAVVARSEGVLDDNPPEEEEEVAA